MLIGYILKKASQNETQNHPETTQTGISHIKFPEKEFSDGDIAISPKRAALPSRVEARCWRFRAKSKSKANTFTLTNPQRNYDKGLYINGVLLAKDESTKPKAVVLSKNTRIDIENEGKYEFYFHSRQTHKGG